MGSPSGVTPASGVAKNNPNPTINPNIPETNNTTYATTLTNSNLLITDPTKQNTEDIKVRKSIHNGMPAVIFKSSDYYGVLAESCRRTIVGRFLRARPQIEKIRSKFNEIFPLKGSVQIGVYDNFNVFIHFTNNDDFNQVWFKRVVEIHGMQMWLQKWTPDFKPEEDEPIVPVWVLLPGLPIHLHNWTCLKHITSSLGIPLTCDLATKNKTRPSMAKIRVEMDLLKPFPSSIWVGMEDDNSPLKGFEQKIEYENVPKFCRHCRKLGHMLMECRVIEKRKVTEEKQQENGTAECRIMAKKKVVEQKQILEKEKVADTLHNDKVFDKMPEPHGEGISKQDDFIEVKTKKRKKNKELQKQDSVRSSEDDDNHKSGEHPTVKELQKSNSVMASRDDVDLQSFERPTVKEAANEKKKKAKKKKSFKKKPKVTFKAGNILLTRQRPKSVRSSKDEGDNSKTETSRNAQDEETVNQICQEVNQCKEPVQEVDQPTKGQCKQTNHTTKEKVDNRAQECPAPDLQSETLSIPAERMSHTEALYQKRLKRMVDGWKKEWRKSLAEKERVQNAISEPL